MAQRNTYREDEELEEQINLRDLRRVAVYLKPYRKRIAAIVAVVVSMSCIAVSVPYLTKIVIDDVLPHKDYALLGWIALIMLVLIMLYEVALRYRTYEITRVGQLVLKDMRRSRASASSCSRTCGATCSRTSRHCRSAISIRARTARS